MRSKLQVVFLLAILVLTSALFVGCEEFDEYGNYDEITKTCKLTVKYDDNSNFFTDGIAKATLLASTTDGDTTQFRLNDANRPNVIIRYFGIDTPESTGQVQKWGKAASKFTDEKLKSATEIVLEASTTPASKDSYGVRYLAYVWYRTSENEEFKNLNLEIVESGYSTNKCINTSEYKYYSYFKEAENFAKKNALRVHGDSVDPLFSSAAQIITLKDFWDNPELYYNSETGGGAKVRIQAYISDLKISGSDSPTYTYVATQIIDGKEYNMDIYAGYSSSQVVGYLTIGDMYSMTGTIDMHNGSYQIGGLKYVAMQSGGDYLSTVQQNYYCTFNDSIEFTGKWGTSLFTDGLVKEVTLDGTTLKIVAAVTQKSSRNNKEEEDYTFLVTVPENFDYSDLVGKYFSTSGFQYESKSKVITITDYKNLNFK